MEEKETTRRTKISCSLKHYFNTDKGIEHRKHLSAVQSKRMALYGKFLNENKIIKNDEANEMEFEYR